MVRVEDSGVSQTPSPSQSQRAWSVALGSGSVDEDASNATELFTLGYGGGEGDRGRGGARGTPGGRVGPGGGSGPVVPPTRTGEEPGGATGIAPMEGSAPPMPAPRPQRVNPAGG